MPEWDADKPADHWKRVIEAYQQFRNSPNGAYLGPMCEFVRRLAADPVASLLYVATSHETLWLTREHPHMDRQACLTVNLSKRRGKFWVQFSSVDDLDRTEVCSEPSLYRVFAALLEMLLDKEKRSSSARWDCFPETEQEWAAEPALWVLDRLPREEREKKRYHYCASVLRAVLEMQLCPCAKAMLRLLDRDHDTWPETSEQEFEYVCKVCVNPSVCVSAAFCKHLRAYSRGELILHELNEKCIDELWTWPGVNQLEDRERLRATRDQAARRILRQVVGNPFRVT